MKTKIFFIWLFFFSALTFSQLSLPVEEHFNYSEGSLSLVGNSSWGRLGIDTTDGQIVNGNLVYPNYPMPATGSQLYFHSRTSVFYDTLSFIPINQNGTQLFASFLVEVQDHGGITNGGTYFFGFSNNLLSEYSGGLARVWIKNDSVNPGVNLGLSKNTSDSTYVKWLNQTFSYNTTFLVVVGYEFVEGIANDTVRLWINPDLSGQQPPADLIATSPNADDYITNFYVRQLDESPDGYVDAIRIATDWNLSPLPVQLSQFSINILSDKVKLEWKTETEKNNFGFDIQRLSQSSKNFDWEKIGFIRGNGTTNISSEYSFIDYNLIPGKYYYRLRQIDNDGKFEYSERISINFSPVKNFSLSQNYPNPFNPTTKIKYTLPEAGSVKLTIYNLLGQEIKVLIKTFQESGDYDMLFDAKDLDSGVYIYRVEEVSLRGNVYSQTKKMTLIK